MDGIVFERHDRASQSSTGSHSIASLKRIEHGLPLFLAALLGKNQQKIKDAEDENQRRNAEPSHPTAELQRPKLCHVQEFYERVRKKLTRQPAPRKLLFHVMVQRRNLDRLRPGSFSFQA